MNSSPSRLRLMCRSARVTVAPSVFSMSSRKRHIRAAAVCPARVELNLLDRRHGLRNAVVGLLHCRDVGGEQTAACDVAEDELAAKRGECDRSMRIRRTPTVLRCGRRWPPDR